MFRCFKRFGCPIHYQYPSYPILYPYPHILPISLVPRIQYPCTPYTTNTPRTPDSISSYPIYYQYPSYPGFNILVSHILPIPLVHHTLPLPLVPHTLPLPLVPHTLPNTPRTPYTTNTIHYQYPSYPGFSILVPHILPISIVPRIQYPRIQYTTNIPRTPDSVSSYPIYYQYPSYPVFNILVLCYRYPFFSRYGTRNRALFFIVVEPSFL